MKRIVLAAVLFVISTFLMGCSDIQGGLVVSGQTMTRNTIVFSTDSFVEAGQQSKLSGVGIQGDIVDDLFKQWHDIEIPTPPEPNNL